MLDVRYLYQDTLCHTHAHTHTVNYSIWAMSQQTLPCTPPPNCRGWVYFVYVSSVPQKNVLKGKPVLFGVILVKCPKNVLFQHIHSNQSLVNLTLLDYNE